MASSLRQNDLLQEFKAFCAGDSALQPLLPILTLAESGQPGKLESFDLINLLIKFCRSDPDLHAKYKDLLPQEVHKMARVHASPNNDRSNNLVRPLGQFHLPPSPLFTEFKTLFSEKKQLHNEVFEGDGKPMWHIPGLEFRNWGLTVSNNPSDSFVARTVVGVQNLVKWAKARGKTVRLAGYRHTWADLYSDDDQVLLMLIPLWQSTVIPAAEPDIDQNSEFQGISVVGTPNLQQHPLVTVKSGTTNEQFRRWCLENKSVCLPFNVIMVEITFGGSNGPICHGAGFSTTTLSDLVAELQYVDANGVVQTVSDPAELRAAAGCFGLLGPVTQLTLRVDRMKMAVMQPVKIRTALAIPPPDGYPIPKEIDMTGITPEILKQAKRDFIARCEHDYYLEWFWFPYHKDVWVNTWQRPDVAIQHTLPPYPSTFQANIQWLQNYIAELIINWEPWKRIPGHLQAFFFGLIAMVSMPNISDPKDSIKTYASEALHFRRGIQNMRCWDSEWEIPIPPVQHSDIRDYSIIQRAWWDAISLHYQRTDAPMRLTLEMRVSGGSDMILAPQRGNKYGTCSIEALTTPITPQADWQSFMQQLINKWASYKSDSGELLNIRPHWAKSWNGFTVRGKPTEQYLKEDAYKEARVEFVNNLSSIVQKRGITVEETLARFGNPLLKRLFFE